MRRCRKTSTLSGVPFGATIAMGWKATLAGFAALLGTAIAILAWNEDEPASRSPLEPKPSAEPSGVAPVPLASTGVDRAFEPDVFGLNEGEVAVSGRLHPSVVKDVVRKRFRRLRLCYEAGLVENPALAGELGVRFTIGADGVVTNIEKTRSTLSVPRVESCIVSEFSFLEFPPPASGVVIVSYSMRFAPS